MAAHRLVAPLFGLVAGATLSAMRAPRGLDWTQLGAVDGMTSGLFRGGALLAIALAIDARRASMQRPLNVTTILAGCAVGYASHALLLAHRLQPTGRFGFGTLLIAASIALWWLAKRTPGTPPKGDEPDPPRDSVSRFERLGLVLGGLGAAFALENLAQQVRQFGGGLPEDDALIGAVFLCIVAIGAICFGTFVSAPRLRRIAPAVGLVLVAAATLHGLHFLGGMHPDPLWRYLKRIGLDYSRIGMWRATFGLAGAAMVISGFVLGTTLSASRHPTRLASMLVGAALALVVRPLGVIALTRPMTFPADAGNAWAWRLSAVGTVVAAVGALVVVIATERGRRLALSTAVVVVATLVVCTRPIVIWSFSPWFITPIAVDLVVPTAAGIVTVEQTTDRTRIVTVDRKRVTPIAEDGELDERRILWAWALLPKEVRASNDTRILVIGQMTPRRADLLRRFGAAEIDRTAPWYDALEAVERALFENPAEIPGSRIAPGEARRRIASGDYDLVLSLPTHGPIIFPRSPMHVKWNAVEDPVLGDLDLPDGTLGIGWLDANSPLSGRDLGPRVVLAMERFEHLTLGIIRGETANTGEEGASNRPILFSTGEPTQRIAPLDLLTTLSRWRAFRLHQALADRLSSAAEGTEMADLALGLALHYRAQEESSLFETRAQSTEVDEDELRAFHAALRSRPVLDAFTRDLWEGVAWLLTEKRMPDMMLAYVESVADAYTPWPALDVGVGRAYQEFLQPEEALRFLERALEADPYNLEAFVSSAEIADELGRYEHAVELIRAALAVQPDRYEFRRALGISLDKSGDPEGRKILLELLRERPEDDLILDRLSQGPSESPGD